MEYKRLKYITSICLILLLLGLSLLFLFFVSIALTFLGASFLALGLFGMVLVRRKAAEIKRTKPEVFKAERERAVKRIEKQKEKELNIKDLPVWLIALLIVAIIIGSMGEIGVFNSNPFLQTVILLLLIFLIIIYYFYKRKITSKKHSGQNPDQSKEPELTTK
jgi:amino acid transporter